MYSAIDPSLRVQGNPWVNFNRWKFFLGYSNIPNPDQPWRGSVLTRKMSECGNGSPHWETKLTSCWWLAEDCHVHIQRKACGTVLGQRWAEIHCEKGQIFLIARTSKACPLVWAVLVGDLRHTHGGLLSLAPHIHSLSVSWYQASP